LSCRRTEALQALIEIKVVIIKNAALNMTAVVVRAVSEPEGQVECVLEDAEKHFRTDWHQVLDVNPHQDLAAADVLKDAHNFETNAARTSEQWEKRHLGQVLCQRLRSGKWKRMKDTSDEVSWFLQKCRPWLIVMPTYMGGEVEDRSFQSPYDYAVRGMYFLSSWEHEPVIINGWNCCPMMAWWENASEGERAEAEGREREESSSEESEEEEVREAEAV
jgi:hypothetical protein